MIMQILVGVLLSWNVVLTILCIAAISGCMKNDKQIEEIKELFAIFRMTKERPTGL